MWACGCRCRRIYACASSCASVGQSALAFRKPPRTCCSPCSQVHPCPLYSPLTATGPTRLDPTRAGPCAAAARARCRGYISPPGPGVVAGQPPGVQRAHAPDAGEQGARGQGGFARLQGCKEHTALVGRRVARLQGCKEHTALVGRRVAGLQGCKEHTALVGCRDAGMQGCKGHAAEVGNGPCPHLVARWLGCCTCTVRGAQQLHALPPVHGCVSCALPGLPCTRPTGALDVGCRCHHGQGLRGDPRGPALRAGRGGCVGARAARGWCWWQLQAGASQQGAADVRDWAGCRCPREAGGDGRPGRGVEWIGWERGCHALLA